MWTGHARSRAPLTRPARVSALCWPGGRVARTIFMGSAPHVQQQQVRGIEDVRVRLGVVQPGEMVAVFNDALGRLVDRLRHLYSGNRRYWYDTQPNLKRTMEDRASRLEAAEVEHEIVSRLRAIRERQDFKAVHTCVPSADIPDEQTARLVILPPRAGHRGQLGRTRRRCERRRTSWISTATGRACSAICWFSWRRMRSSCRGWSRHAGIPGMEINR